MCYLYGEDTYSFFFFFQAEDGIRDWSVTGVQTCALPISSELARRSLLSPPGIAKRLDRLQTAGFVTRASNPRDRRSSILRLTPRGQRVVHAITTKQLDCDNAAVFAIPDHELNQLSATLRRLLRELPSPRKGRHSDNGV